MRSKSNPLSFFVLLLALHLIGFVGSLHVSAQDIVGGEEIDGPEAPTGLVVNTFTLEDSHTLKWTGENPNGNFVGITITFPDGSQVGQFASPGGSFSGTLTSNNQPFPKGTYTVTAVNLSSGPPHETHWKFLEIK